MTNGSNWWADKMGAPTPAPAPPPLIAPSQIPMAQMPQIQPQMPTHLPSANMNPSRCPGCGSGNYVQVGSQVTANGSVSTFRCYDCGYPIVQQGSGMGSGGQSSGPVQAARQVATGGWNPTTIIDRIS